MPVIWHDDIRENTHIEGLFYFGEQIFKVFVIEVVGEDLQTTVCTIDDVIYVVAEINAILPSHEYIMT